MEITKQWIAKVAGWKANKAGKDILTRGAVLESAKINNIITGAIQSGAKPTRVTVKIHSEIDIDTICPRLQCRRTGEICEHAVAVMLHHLSEDSLADTTIPTKSIPKAQHSLSEPLIIQLPPNFPASLFSKSNTLGGLSVKLSPAPESKSNEIDQKLSDWITASTQQDRPNLIGLRGDQAVDFLIHLRDHDRVFSGENLLQIAPENSRLPMSLEYDDGRINIGLSEHLRLGSQAWHLGELLFLWDDESKTFAIHPTTGLWKTRYWQRIATMQMISLPVKEFLQSRELVADHIIWDDDSKLQSIPISSDTPRFELTIDGSTKLLSARLKAIYSNDQYLIIGLNQTHSIQFPIPHPEIPDHFLDRNRLAEDEAAGILLQSGFQIIDSEGGWQLNDSDGIIDFLTSTMPTLENNEQWTICTSNTLKSAKNNMVRIIPDFDFKEVSSSGQDWLAYDVQFKTDQGKDIPKEVIQRMLATGKRSGTSKNGKQVIISNFDADTVETVLRDTNPRQENGLYIAAKSQAAYLRRLREHYSGPKEDQPDTTVISKLPEAIQATLRPYQEEGIAWLYHRAKHDQAALLADDMGLGKTLQTLALLHLLEDKKHPSLVVCPTSLLGNWEAETKKFFPAMKTLILHGNKRKDYFSVAHSADIIITSYALIARDIDFYSIQKWGTLVIDEASIIRNPDTQSAKALCKLDASHRIALTGTPVENAVRDLWSLYRFLLPGYLGSRKDFQQFYEKPLSGNLPDNAVMKRLRMRIAPFMLRRTKSTVAKDLPPKIHQTIYCDPSPSQKKTYAKLLLQGAAKVDALEDGAARMQILTVLLRLRQASCDLRLLDPEMKITQEEASAKMVRLLEMLIEAKQGGHRVLLFSQFTSMLALIKSALEAAEISYAYLDGATKDRTGEVAKFQSPSGPDVFLISLKAGGYGLNLTAADTVIHFDPWWNPAVEAQATDRAYRIGQTKPTTVYKFVTRGTVEEKILKLQASKQGLISSALGDESEPLMQGLSQDEIAGLLHS